jgi:hypothetical protein
MRNLIILFCFIFQYSVGQNTHIINKTDTLKNTFAEELHKYVYEGKYESSATSIYAIYVYSSDTLKKCRSYTVSSFMNSSEYYLIEPQYIVLDNNESIVVRFSDEIKDKTIDGLNLKIIDEEEKNKIMKKLPREPLFITYGCTAFIYNICGKDHEVIYYDNSIEVPKGKSIYKNDDEFNGGIILIKGNSGE